MTTSKTLPTPQEAPIEEVGTFTVKISRQDWAVDVTITDSEGESVTVGADSIEYAMQLAWEELRPEEEWR